MTLSTADYHQAWSFFNELSRLEKANDAVTLLFQAFDTFSAYDTAVVFPFEPDLMTVADSGHLSRDMGDLERVALDYATHYHQLDPLNVLEQPENHNHALRTQDVIGARKYRESEFYRDFSKPLGIGAVLGVCATYRDSPVCGISFHREKNNTPFAARDQELLTLIAPSFAAGLRALQWKQETEHRLAIDDDGKDGRVAVWLLEPHSHRVRCNAQAVRLVQGTETRMLDRFDSRFPLAVQQRLHRLIGAARKTEGMLVSDPISDSVSCRFGNDWYTYTMTALPAGRVAGLSAPVVVTATRRATCKEIEDRMRAWGLSEREQEIGRHVVWGLSNKQIASCLGVTEQTVKDHMRSIFAKTQANTRTQFVAWLAWGG